MKALRLLSPSLVALAFDSCAGFSAPARFGALPRVVRPGSSSSTTFLRTGSSFVGAAEARVGVVGTPTALLRMSTVERVEDAPAPTVVEVEAPTADIRRSPPPGRRRRFQRSKQVAVAVVPPASATDVWDALTEARTLLNDPLLYRWPPHANLLYPFLALRDMDEDGDGDDDGDGGGMFEDRMLRALERAAARCEPFEVSLSCGEAFGGPDRGVVWLYPRSYRPGDGTDKPSDDEGCAFLRADPSEPLIRLHALLEESFPMLVDPRERRGGNFHPHVTLGNYRSLDLAREFLGRVESWWEEKTFKVEEFYVLRREGDDGQFEIAATIPLGAGAEAEGEGAGKKRAVVHDPPLRFPGMPAEEVGWVREERAKFESWTKERKERRTRKKKLEAEGAKTGENQAKTTSAAASVVVPEIPEQDEGEYKDVKVRKMDAHEMFRRTRMRHRRRSSRRRR